MQNEIWKEVFKAGLHTDAGGTERNWTSEDLDKIVSKYNNQLPENKHEAPVVIGHPVNNSPAYAWVEELKKDGDRILAKFNQLDPDFGKLIQEGRYKKVSIALYPDMMLRHIGFLGAIPPAVKGLKDSQFNAELEFISFESEQNRTELNRCSIPVQQNSNKNEQKKRKERKRNIYYSPSKSEVFEGGDSHFKNEQNNFPKSIKSKIHNQDKNFNDSENNQPINFQGGAMPVKYTKLFEDLLSWIANTFNEEVASQTAEELERIKVKYLNSPGNPNNSNSGSEANDANKNIEIPQSKEFMELQKKLEILEKDNRDMKFNEYFKSQLGRLVPAQKQLVKLAFESVQNLEDTFEFSEQGKTVKIKGEQLIKKLIESFPLQVDFNERADKNMFSDSGELEEQNKFIDEYYKNEGDK